MNKRTSFSFLIVVMLGIATTAQQIKAYLSIDIDAYSIERYAKNTKARYDAIHKLVDDVENEREDEAPYNISKMPESYLTYVQEALNYAVTNDKVKDLQLFNNHKFDHYQHYGTRQEGILLATKILMQTQQIKDSFKFQLYTYLHTVYQDLGLNTEFIELIPKMYALKQKMNLNDNAAGNQDAAVANSYYLNKNYDIAIEYYYKALAFAQAKDNTILTAQVHNSLGQSFGRLTKTDSAVLHYEKAITAIEKTVGKSKAEDAAYLRYFYNKVFTNKAELLYAETLPDSVIPYALKTFQTFPSHENPIHIASTFNLLGKLYYTTGDYQQAKSYLVMARENLKPGVNALDHLENIKTEAQLALVNGDKKKGAKLFQFLEKFEDSIAQLKSDTRMAVALTAYDLKEKEIAIKEQELQIVAKDNALKEQKQQQLLYIIIIGGFIILILLGFIYIKKLNKQNEKIILQKIALDNSLKQKELLLKEVHHRVKNNLQIVSSLLEAQAGKTDDILLKSIMTEGQDRIDAMALIHQQLYQSTDFKNIDLKNYVDNLFKHLYMSHNKENVQVQYLMNIDVTPIDIDVAVPFGIILNELISNCYKYAFKNRDKGIIKVSIKAVNETYNELTVADNGVGLPEDFEIKKSHSLGIKLIEGVAWQLRGKLSYQSSKKGSIFKVIFIKNLENLPDHNES